MVTTQSISLAIPDFKTMSDDDVEAHVLTRHRDGRWSTQTRWLLSIFGTDKLELNEAWAENWTDWACPACGRAKIELARLTEQNVLLCQLDWHHDHLRDHASRLMRAQLTGYPGEDDRRAARSISAALPLIERFSETLLCNDCNAADAAMKAQLGKQVPSYFSFRPSEIARFVVVEPNRTQGWTSLPVRRSGTRSAPTSPSEQSSPRCSGFVSDRGYTSGKRRLSRCGRARTTGNCSSRSAMRQ